MKKTRKTSAGLFGGRKSRLAACFCILAIMLLASGCFLGRDALFNHAVERYLKQMEEVFPEDTFTFSEVSGVSGRQVVTTVSARSEKYDQEFEILIANGLEFSDNYYQLYLKEPMQKYAEAVLKKELPGRQFRAEGIILTEGFYYSSLSYQYTSMEDVFYQHTGTGIMGKISVKELEGDPLSKSEIDKVLRYLQGNGFKGSFVPGDEAVWYQIYPGRITRLQKSGSTEEVRDYVPGY